MKIDEAIEIITNAVQTDKMTVEQDEALAIVQRETKKRIPQKPIFGYDEQDDICCPACGIEIAAMTIMNMRKNNTSAVRIADKK